jgi:hypothetical protein
MPAACLSARTAAAVDPGNAVALCHRGRAQLLLMRVPQVQAAARADLEAALALLSQDSSETAAERPWHDVGYWRQRVLGLLATLE